MNSFYICDMITSDALAKGMDLNDPLKHFRDKFYIPIHKDEKAIYFLGNSLGLQPKTTQDYVLDVMEQWANFGVEGFFWGEEKWMDLHYKVAQKLTTIVGANSNEITIMNALTVNLHLMLQSFYKPHALKTKIICEPHAFPSDQYALQSFVESKNLSTEDTIIEVNASKEYATTEEIIKCIEENHNETCLIFISGVHYLSGYLFDIEKIAQIAKKYNIIIGLDLAHAVGNVPLQLHNWDIDFAVWCHYKYLNAGPGAIGGAFVNSKNFEAKKLTGWWGNDKNNRFKMMPKFTSANDATSWQHSTPPMVLLASLNASLDIFLDAGLQNIFEKSKNLFDYLILQLNEINNNDFEIITPTQYGNHGSQVSIKVLKEPKQLFDALIHHSVFADWREPNIIRFAPVPLYNNFEDINKFIIVLNGLLVTTNEI